MTKIKSLLKFFRIERNNIGINSADDNYNPKIKRESITSFSPIDGNKISNVNMATFEDYEYIIEKSIKSFKQWSQLPAPNRGLIIQEIAKLIVSFKKELAELITIETGKIIEESLGEIQEMIDMAHFAVGQSRQLYGKTMHSERKFHRMYEQWHPLGVVGIITSFNFPLAVWSWNAFLAVICGNCIIWKPSLQTPITALAIQNLINPIIKKYEIDGVFNLIIGTDNTIGDALINDNRIPLISATGSCKMGRHVGGRVANRFGKSLLELGGNNASIITSTANLDLASEATFFGAIATSGQRCTTTRRLIIHKSIKDEFISLLLEFYKKIKIGNPLDQKINMGPLINSIAVNSMMQGIEVAKKSGGNLIFGGNITKIINFENGFYVKPALLEAKNSYKIVKKETFAPILYIIEYTDLEEAIEMNNDVPQGLSSTIFTNNLIESEKFLSVIGSDCGIANVNTSTNGAEIGGAFGGEKNTGGGRESGSDSWKNYMRRQTNTINWNQKSVLAQNISFKI